MAASTGRSDRPFRPWVPYFVLVLSVVLSVAAAGYVAMAARQRDRIRFQNAVQDVRDSIQGRIETYTALLRAGTGLFAESGTVSRLGFQAFVSRLDLPQRYPGIQGIGYIARTAKDDVPELVKSMRIQGASAFHIDPAGDRPEYYPVIYLDPFSGRNRTAIGYDMWTDPVRRAAMERARDTGMPAASGRVMLVEEVDGRRQPGFLIFVPVYEGGQVPETEAARRASLIGFVYSPFRAGDVLKEILDAHTRYHVSLQVFDGTTHDAAHMLYDSGTPAHAGPALGPRFTTTASFVLAGRSWDLAFTTRPDFYEESSASQLPLILAGGLIISLVLFGVARLEAQARSEAERAAAELRISEEALRESESRLRRLVDANIIGIIIADLGGRIIEANDAFLSIVGYTRGDLQAGRVNWGALTPDEYRPVIDQALEDTRRVGRHEPFEAGYIRKDGSVVPALVGTAFLGGRQNLVVGFLLDLTERKRAEREREELLQREREAHAEAQAANRAKDAFLATVSHELRTPLNAILGWAKMLHMGHLDESRKARAVEVIERNAQMQVRLIEDLLDVSRITAGKLRLDVRPVELGPVLQTALDAVRPAADAKGVKLDWRFDASPDVVLGDAERLQQIFWNLLSNAIKFTPQGGAVMLVLERTDGAVIVRVTDTGIGMAPDFLPHIFEPFRQADSSTTRSHSGVGLGLAIVRHLVEIHGGTIRAQSEGERCGSTFIVELPARPVVEAAAGDGPFTEARVDGVAD
ncbi:MAG: CHASE domain-containing protein [Acidobacteriota bacterium]|nr:CHASE domain-containing protein [Acidobacteriota bacterium]